MQTKGESHRPSRAMRNEVVCEHLYEHLQTRQKGPCWAVNSTRKYIHRLVAQHWQVFFYGIIPPETFSSIAEYSQLAPPCWLDNGGTWTMGVHWAGYMQQFKQRFLPFIIAFIR